MMYLKAIHRKDVESTLDREYSENNEFCKAIFEEMDNSLRTARELREFGIYTEDNEESLGTIFVNGIRKIGERIIAILNSMQQFVKDFITKVKAGIWEAKNEEQQLRELARRYPDKIGEIKIAVSRDELNFATYKDLMEFYANADDILRDIERQRINPKSARGRWEALKSKMTNSEGFWKATGAMFGALGAGAALVVSCTKIIEFMDKRKEEAENLSRANDKFCQNCKMAYNALSKTAYDIKLRNGGYTDAAKAELMDNAQIIQEMSNFMNLTTCGNLKKFDESFTRWVMSLSGEATTALAKLDNMQHGLKSAITYYDINRDISTRRRH